MFDGLRLAHWQADRRPDGILVLTLDRSDQGVNALSRAVLDELESMIERLQLELPKGIVIISGKDAGFIPGADIKGFEQIAAKGLVEDWIEDELGIRYAELVLGRGTGLPSVRLKADFKAVSHLGDPVALTLAVERIGNSSLTLNLRCDAADGREMRVNVRQVIVTTSLVTHQAIDIPPDLRTAVARFAQVVH